MKNSAIILALALFTALAFAGQCQDRCNDQYTIGLNMAGEYLQEKWYVAQERPESAARLSCPQWTYIFDFVEEGRLIAANNACYSENRACHDACDTGECGENCDDVLTQQCCHNATLSFLVEAKANCLEQCGSETPTPTPTSCGYERIVSSEGDVRTEPVGTSTRFVLGENGTAVINFQKRPGTDGEAAISYPIVIRLYPNTDFKLAPCVPPSQLGGRDCAASFADEGQTLYFSSEHGSIRGTINGGGDFIQGPEPNEARFDVPPPQLRRFGKVEIVESNAIDAPDFTLGVSLPEGDMIVSSVGGYTSYAAEPVLMAVAQPEEEHGSLARPGESSVEFNVISGTISVKDEASGGEILLGEGDTGTIAISDLEALAATPTPWQTPAQSPTQTPSVQCVSSSDCPSSQSCEDGRCVEMPTCFSLMVLLGGGVLAALLLAARH